MRLVLVRHGATAWSEAGRLNGWTDIPLSLGGRDQARRLRRALGQAFDSVWASDLLRAEETARLAVGDARADGRLRELDFGSLEGATWASLTEPLRRELVDFDGFRAPGGESVADLRARVLALVGELGPGTHLLVTHGGVIRTLLRGQDRDPMVPPGGVVELVVPEVGATWKPEPWRPDGADVLSSNPRRERLPRSARPPGS